MSNYKNKISREFVSIAVVATLFVLAIISEGENRQYLFVSLIIVAAVLAIKSLSIEAEEIRDVNIEE